MTMVVVGTLGVAAFLWLLTPAGCAFALTQGWLVAIGWSCPIS